MHLLKRACWRSSTILRALYSTAAQSQLATLRKQTGYSIKNCKKALELHNNDLEVATKWLNDEAQKQGWEKATKLQNRTTLQGLVGVQLKDKTAALVEVCCETDFVSRNDIFKDLVRNVTSACCMSGGTKTGSLFSEEHLGQEEMSNLRWEGKKLSDHVALAISQLGESIVLRRGRLLHAAPGLVLSASVHPSTTDTTATTLIGIYAALVALKPLQTQNIDEAQVDEMGRQLCKHIIGMKPKSILPESGETQSKVRVMTDDHSEEPDVEQTEESFLLGQSFVFNQDLLVKDILDEKGLEVVHFLRFERGETVDTQ